MVHIMERVNYMLSFFLWRHLVNNYVVRWEADSLWF